MKKIRTFIIKRDVLTQVWVKESFTIEAKNLAEAIDIARIVPEHDLYELFPFEQETLFETEITLSSLIKVEDCYEIPTQLKLEF